VINRLRPGWSLPDSAGRGEGGMLWLDGGFAGGGARGAMGMRAQSCINIKTPPSGGIMLFCVEACIISSVKAHIIWK
jgi:hypothetical protein